MRLIVFQILSAELDPIDFKSNPITAFLIFNDVDGSFIMQAHIPSVTIQQIIGTMVILAQAPSYKYRRFALT